jgi:hypothetical protein
MRPMLKLGGIRPTGLYKIKVKYETRIGNNDIHCYIIVYNETEICFIQIYDAYKFPRSKQKSSNQAILAS